MFKIHMGVPEMKEFWASLKETVKTGKASKNDERMYKRIGKSHHLHISRAEGHGHSLQQ